MTGTTTEPSGPELQGPWHALSAGATLAGLRTHADGLTSQEAAIRLARVGPNRLPRAQRPGWPLIFARQFKNPLVYLLVLATVVSVVVGEVADALFIFVVLLFNAVIGTFQEWRAQRSADALDALIREVAVVRRDGYWTEIDAEQLVPGDLVRLDSGARVAADIRLLASAELRADESLLTGESTPVDKLAGDGLPAELPLAERTNMLFAGSTLPAGGRAVS